MARYGGKDGTVMVDGVEIARITTWSLQYSPVILEHRGAGMQQPHLYIDTYVPFTVSFTAEADTADSGQLALLGTVAQVSLTLRESSGAEHSVTAIVYGGVSVSREAAVTRSYQGTAAY
jgi:hypothetical protein